MRGSEDSPEVVVVGVVTEGKVEEMGEEEESETSPVERQEQPDF